MMGRPTTYSPTILPLVRCAAHFGATRDEIAAYIGVSIGSFKQWALVEKDLHDALKRGRENSDARVVDSLYQRALAGDVTACIFWLKNRKPTEWRDVQNIEANTAHYILSDKPMSESEWIAARADAAKLVSSPALAEADVKSQD